MEPIHPFQGRIESVDCPVVDGKILSVCYDAWNAGKLTSLLRSMYDKLAEYEERCGR